MRPQIERTRHVVVGLVAFAGLIACMARAADSPSTSHQQHQQSSQDSARGSLLKRLRASRARPQAGATGSVVEVQAPPSVATNVAPNVAGNRSTRTADVFQNGDGFNLFVTNTCERDTMRVNIRTSRPFYGVIHTRDQRQKSQCSVEGNGDTEYNLELSQALNPNDPAFCGAIRGARGSPDDKEIVSVIVAVRVHRTIELSDDRFFLLNCTNRCRRPDCSSGSARLQSPDEEGPTSLRSPNSSSNLNANPNGRLTSPADSETSTNEGAGPLGEREGANDTRGASNNECTIWRFPWAIALLWCLGILALALLISHCILCSSFVCRCVRREVEETEPSVYEGASDLDESYASGKKHPYRIEYDNRDIYKTTNNYEPYCLDDNNDDTDTDNKRQHHRRHTHRKSGHHFR